MKDKIYLILAVIFIATPNLAYSDDKINYDDYLIIDNEEKFNSDSYLYIPNAEDMKNVDTVTYYISDAPASDKNLIKTFSRFSDLIGKNNGAVFMYLNEDISFTNKSYDIDYINLSKCSDKSIFKNKNIIFEDRKNKYCFNIPIKNIGYITPILSTIIINIKNIKSLKKKADYIKFKQAILKDLKELGIPKENIFIAEKILKYIKSKYNEVFN